MKHKKTKNEGVLATQYLMKLHDFAAREDVEQAAADAVDSLIRDLDKGTDSKKKVENKTKKK